MTEFRGAAKRRTRRGHRPSHRVDRVQGRGQEEDTEPSHRAQPRPQRRTGARPRGGQEEDKAQPQSPATELTEFRGQDGQEEDKAQPQSPGHRVDRVQGRGQEEDKAQPQSPATELTEFRGAAKRRTRGGQGPATEQEDKATELTEFRGAAKRRTRPSQS